MSTVPMKMILVSGYPGLLLNPAMEPSVKSVESVESKEPIVSFAKDWSGLPQLLPTGPQVEIIPQSIPQPSAGYTVRDYNSFVQGNSEIRTILGVVKKNQPMPDKSNLITVLSHSSNREFQIICPFFCPTRAHDVLTGFCVEVGGRYRFIREPVVEPGASAEVIKSTFIIYMGKTKFKQRLADALYNYFERQARAMIDEIGKKRLKIQDEQSTVMRTRDNLNATIMEVISIHAQRFRIHPDTIRPLVELGLSEKQAQKLLTGWYNSFSLRRLYLLGIRKKSIRKACQRGWTADTLYYQLLENPYIVETIPMETATSIAQKYELSFDQNMIEAAYVVRFVDQQTKKFKGTYHPIYPLLKKYPRFHELQDVLKRSYKCRIRYNGLYLRHQAQIEDYLTELLEPQKFDMTYCSDRTQQKLACPEQIEALDMILNNRVSVMTGGGGSGKTRAIGALCEELELRNEKYLVAAFTGKAVARIKEVVPDPGKVLTLHMILGRSRIENITTLIIDEISMAPNELLCRVLLHLLELSLFEPVETLQKLKEERKVPLRIVLVGDDEQLQPIKPGDLFNQILASGVIPVKYLQEDHRRVNQGTLYHNMKAYREHQADFIFQFGQDCTYEQGNAADVINAAHIEFLNGTSHRDITVVCPFGDELDEINRHCQDLFLDKSTPFLTDSFGKTWKVGARVMMTVNRYDINVMNGDEGIVTGVMPSSNEIQVEFNNGEVVRIPTYIPMVNEESNYLNYESNERVEPLSTKLIALSWASTVHKVQGHQWKTVIFYLPKGRSNNGFINRKLVYTGASRAEENLRVIADTMESFVGAFYVDPPNRYDNLAKRLRKERYFEHYVDAIHAQRMLALSTHNPSPLN